MTTKQHIMFKEHFNLRNEEKKYAHYENKESRVLDYFKSKALSVCNNDLSCNLFVRCFIQNEQFTWHFNPGIGTHDNGEKAHLIIQLPAYHFQKYSNINVKTNQLFSI